MSAGPPIPDELWQQIPPAAQAAILSLIQHYERRLADLEARLNKNSTNSSGRLGTLYATSCQVTVMADFLYKAATTARRPRKTTYKAATTARRPRKTTAIPLRAATMAAPPIAMAAPGRGRATAATIRTAPSRVTAIVGPNRRPAATATAVGRCPAMCCKAARRRRCRPISARSISYGRATAAIWARCRTAASPPRAYASRLSCIAS